MKILFTAHQFFPDYGAGTEVLTLGLARELRARGHETRVLAAKRSGDGGLAPGEVEDYEYAGVPVRRVGRPEEGLSRSYRLNYDNPEMARRAREYVREFGPDVVHAMHLQGLSTSVLPVFKELGLPIVFTSTDFWSICPVVELRRYDRELCTGPELAYCMKCLADRNPDPRAKKVLSVPNAALSAVGALSRTRAGRSIGPLRQIGELDERPRLIRERLRLVDHIVAPTEIMYEMLAANGISEDRLHVSHYGIDTTGLTEVPRLREPSGTLRAGFMGTLGPNKGADTLVRAFQELSADRDATLTLHGGTRDYKDFEREVRELAAGDPRIRFAGPFPREEIAQVLAGMDVLVVPSRWYENAPGVIFEAFAAGTPVVATDLGGMSEIVEHDVNGLLFPLENHAGLARQLRRLCDEPGLLRRLGEGIGHVKTVAENAAEIEPVYEQLLAGASGVIGNGRPGGGKTGNGEPGNGGPEGGMS